MKTVVITGAAGFIGFHLASKLLEEGYRVIGVDSMSSYYDIRIKEKRIELLSLHKQFTFTKLTLEDYEVLERLLKEEKPDEIIHLAAQAGVRYSLSNPWAYAQANYLGTLNLFEAAKRTGAKRVLYASSSSVYGANAKQPFSEDDRTDQPISIYAASKKANEALAYSYFHLYGMEMIGFRFFTVYGRWGRPDLALFKFTRNILLGEPISLYNEGNMKRSFTHISDVVSGIYAALLRPHAGRYDIYNLGGAEAATLSRFVELIEHNLGTKTEHILEPLQQGDVPETVADCSKAARELGYVAKMSLEDGVEDFVAWFRENKEFLLSLSEPKQ